MFGVVLAVIGGLAAVVASATIGGHPATSRVTPFGGPVPVRLVHVGRIDPGIGERHRDGAGRTLARRVRLGHV